MISKPFGHLNNFSKKYFTLQITLFSLFIAVIPECFTSSIGATDTLASLLLTKAIFYENSSTVIIYDYHGMGPGFSS
jgi:hypothetical protein